MKIIGHRGVMGRAPENTLKSLKKALELGVDMIEFDVQTLKDGTIVLMHDDTLDRTTNGRGFISDKTYEEIAQLDAGEGERIPTLYEALDVIDRKVPVIIEMTGFLPTVGPVTEIVKKYLNEKGWSKDDILLASFKHPELVIAKQILPEIKTIANMSAVPVSYATFAQEASADCIAIENLYTYDAAFIDDAHKRGMDVYLYSVDEEEYLSRYQSLGIDGVFSNTPDRVRRR